jgi:hypothetical protein
MRRLLLGLFLFAACSSSAEDPPGQPCIEAPCPKSEEAPCGLPEGCNFGECDLVEDEPGLVFTCFDEDPLGIVNYCNAAAGRVGSAVPCSELMGGGPPDAGL